MSENEVQGDTATLGEPRPLRRSREHRLVAGVCGGLADYFGLSPAIYRIIFIALTVAGGTGLLLYAIAALVIPVEGSDDSLAADALREHRDRPWLVIGMALLALAAVFVLSGPHGFWPVADGIWVLALLAGALIVLREIARRNETAGTDAESQPRDTRRSVFWPGLGLLVVCGGVLGLIDATDAASINWTVVFAGGVILVGVLVALGFRWRGAAALALLALPLLLAMGVALALDDVSLGGGLGDRVERPLLAAELKRDYRLGVGQLELDLRSVELAPGETRISAHVGVGELLVELPSGVPVEVISHVRAGDSEILGHDEDGWRIRDRVVDPGFANADRRLVVDATVGIGDVEVRRP